MPQIERVGIVSEVGKLLSLTSGEAQHFGLAELVDNREELLYALGVTGELIQSSPTPADNIISLLPSGPVQALLILLGLVLIFMEVQSPGFGIPGIMAVLAFMVVFGASAMLGRVGSLEIILFLLGLGLLVVEIFVLPGFGIIGISGFLLIGSSLVLSMQDFVIPRFDWEWALLGRNITVVIGSLMTAVLGIAIIALMSPKMRLFDRIMLKAQITGTAGGPDPDSPVGKAIIVESGHLTEDGENLAALVGKTGTANTILRPSGRAQIDGKTYTVDSDNEFVDFGADIVVTRVRGSRIIVKKV
jgi:membrane-bound serine protease (ClpP class)